MEHLQNKNWWGRNWKWFVPTGCLTLLVLFIAFIAIIFFVIFGSMKQSEAYKFAIAKANKSEIVKEHIGTPVKEGFFVSGSVSVNGAGGHAELKIPISGPKGEGKLYVKGEKSAGHWLFDELIFEDKKSGEKFNLLSNET